MAQENRRISNSFWIGVIIVCVGTFLMLDKMDLFVFPGWLLSWEMMLICIGLLVGISNRFEGMGWFVIVLIGVIFIIDDIPGFPYSWRVYMFPLALIIIGLIIITKTLGRSHVHSSTGSDGIGISSTANNEEVINMSCVLGGNKKNLLQKL